MTNEYFQRFISGCPSLQELVIVNLFEMTKLSISAPNIDKLSVFLLDEHLLNHPRPLLLYFPDLKNLYLEINSWKLDIIDVSSVRNIYIKYLNFYMNHHDDLVLTINQALVGKFEGIEVFRLSRNASKEFLHSIQNLELVQCKWKRIVLEVQDFCNNCVLGLYHLMKSLAYLEELIIYTTEDFKASRGLLRIYFPPPPYVTPQLKTVTLHGYAKSWKSQVRLVELLLKRAAALDKLIIVPINHRLKEEEQLEFVKHLSRSRRASPTARVIFS
ncbi:uncharacterized protein LOC141594137 [Silene latifolia]|uniref:uncharacterized protein LOC141594137 n=1 Tax=Silene latifolia TaxID=37657 RepID=UPI003D778ADE